MAQEGEYDSCAAEGQNFNMTHVSQYGLLGIFILVLGLGLIVVVGWILYRTFGTVPSAVPYAGARQAWSSPTDGSLSSQSPPEGPMSDYNSKALKALQGRLKTSVVMEQLIDMLEPPAGGFMNATEAQSVRNAKSPMGQLIEILLSKGDKEFNTLCDMLKKSNHSAWANRLRQEAEGYRTKNQMDNCKAVATVHPAYDVETLEVGDYKYLRKAIQNATKEKKTNPRRVMKTLYHHTYHRVVNITANYGAQCFRDIMVVARTAFKLRLVKGDIKALDNADTVADMLDVLHDDEDWKDTGLLEEIVNYLPKDARMVAVSLLDRYNSYLKVFEEELPVQNLPTSDVAVPEGTRARVEITVAKKITEYTSKDCKAMLHLLLHICWQCPHDEDIVGVHSGSTTVVLLIDKAFTENIIQYSLTANSLWAFQELRVTRVRVGAFELNVVQLLIQHFKEAVCSGLTGGMDFVGAIKAIPYQVHALVDSDITEKLVIRTVYSKIAQPSPEQEGLVSGTADSEGVETTSKMYEDNFPPKVEGKAELDDEGKIQEATDSGELLSHVQKLEDDLKNSEWKTMDLTQENMALVNNLKICREQKDHTEKENASLKKRLVSILSSQDEGKMSEEVTGSGELLSSVQQLEDELKDSERKRMDLIQSNTDLQKILKACREQEACAQQEIASLWERLGGANQDSAPTAPSDIRSKRIPHRWWLKVSAGSYDTYLLPSSPMKQAEGGREMDGEVVFRRDTKSNLLKAVSGTEWMYRRRTLERSRRHQFTRYHQSWLADNVQKEEEESCKQWLLQLSPDVGSVREGEEQGLMSKVYKQALRDYQEKIAGVLIVKNIISDLKPYLTTVEYLQVKNKLGNMAQVDELFRILLTKGNGHFKGFCHVLEDTGYQYWAQQLRSSTDGAETEAHPMSPWNRDALVSLREKFQLRVLMETGLCNRLEEATGGFMNDLEAATVREQPGNIQQMGKVIDILCGKGDKDFSTFLQMLRWSNNEVWAEELERKAEDFKRNKAVPREGDDALCQEVTAENVLDFFRDSFIKRTDANTIVYELRHRKIISNDDLTKIERNPDPKQQNEILHRCLTRSCDEEALMEVCDMMIAVDGNRRMNTLGQKMKCKLEVSETPSSPSLPIVPVPTSAQPKEEGATSTVSETPSSPIPPIGPVPTSAQPKKEGATSTEWQLAYEDSIRKYGSVSVEVIQSILVGPSAAGKSTVKHLLVHNEPKEVKTSTAALETPEVVTRQSAMEFSSEQYAVQEGTSAWQPVSSDIMKNSLHDCIASKEYEEKNQYPIEVEAKEAEDVQRKALIMKQAQSDTTALLGQYPIEEGQHEAEERDGCPLPKRLKSDFAMLDQQYIQVREEMGGEGERIKLKNASFIHLLDTGGQPSFQDVLPLLLDVPCTYIQVFNASNSLSERIPVTYRPNDHTVVSLGDAECGRDMMLRSFSSVHTMSQKYSKELATFQQDSPPPQLRIFVVGTHKDKLIAQGRLDEAIKEIKTFLETLKGKPYYNSIQWDSKGQKFYLVNALSVNERAYVNDLRERISSEGFLKLDVPLMWFICQEVTRCTPKKFFRLQDLEAFCRKHHFVDGENAASQFRALLQLLTLLGFYAFFDLEDVPDEANFVCTDRGVFLREVSTLLAVQFSVPKGPEMESFKETGILVFTQKCFKQLGICQEMDAQWFLKALQHLGIAAHLPSKDRVKKYFIPAALPQSSREQKPTASVAPLCLTYTTEEDAGSSQHSYMPRGVFCRLAVELIRQGWKIIAKESTRTLLLFRWREFEIFLKESSGYISLIPQVVEEISTIPELHTQCVRLLDVIRGGLSLSAKAVLGSNFRDVAELAVGFECPCKEVAMDHLAVPSQTGKSLDCLGTCKSQPYCNNQRIWFSSLAGVHGVELKHHPSEPDSGGRSIWLLKDYTCSGNLFTTCNAQQVLDHFRDRFIREVDATIIVRELEYHGIISDGVRQEVTAVSGSVVQNQTLHAHLVRTCTKKSLDECL